MKKAILFGASGFVGSYLLEDLLAHPDYEEVTIVVRRPIEKRHAKLKMLIGDFEALAAPNSPLALQLKGEDIFLALGTTQKHTPDRGEYYRIDHDYPVLAAKIAKENGATSVFVVSAVGANAGSRFFYVKTKGETERDLVALGFQRTGLFQPSMILGERKEKRTLEKSLITLWTGLNPLFMGPLKSYRGIGARDIAKSMVRAANSQTEKVKTYRWHEMIEMSEMLS